MKRKEWQPEQYAMKLRAPRCRDGRLPASLSALRCQPAWPPSLAETAPAPNNSANAAATLANLVGMVGHSFRNRAVSVGLGYERQQEEEREVQRRADAGQRHVQGIGGLQPQPHQHQD